MKTILTSEKYEVGDSGVTIASNCVELTSCMNVSYAVDGEWANNLLLQHNVSFLCILKIF